MEVVELAEADVRLRQHVDADVDAAVEMCRDPEFARWTTVPVPYERRHAVDYVARVAAGWASGDAYGWAVEHDGRYAGNLDLRRGGGTAGAGAATVGFGLGAWARGRGVVPAALRLAARWAFAPAGEGGLGLEALHWDAYVGNWSSRRAAWKAGFRYEGTVRSFRAARGVRHDAWVGSLLPGDPLEPAGRWLDVPELSDGVVRLRRWRDADAPRIVAACTDPTTRYWLSSLPDPYDEDVARGYVGSREEDHATGRAVHWCVADAADDRCLASVSLMHLGGSVGTPAGEVGYWAAPDARGRHVVSRAVRLVSAWAFGDAPEGLGLERVYLYASVGNAASRGVAVRSGFAPSGSRRRAERLGDGSVTDLVTYDRLRGDPLPALD